MSPSITAAQEAPDFEEDLRSITQTNPSSVPNGSNTATTASSPPPFTDPTKIMLQAPPASAQPVSMRFASPTPDQATPTSPDPFVSPYQEAIPPTNVESLASEELDQPPGTNLAHASLASAPTSLAHVTLQGLNKTSSKSQEIQVGTSDPAIFGNLDINLLQCWQSPPDEMPESKALLEIWEKQPGEKEKKLLFNGWMFSSSPSLSALEHPVYDLTVIRCM